MTSTTFVLNAFSDPKYYRAEILSTKLWIRALSSLVEE